MILSRHTRRRLFSASVNRVVSGDPIFVNYAMQRGVMCQSRTYAWRLSYRAGACQSISRARSLPSETDNGRCSASNAIRLCVARTYANARARTHAHVAHQCTAWRAYLAVRSNSNFTVILTLNDAASFGILSRARPRKKHDVLFRAPRAYTTRCVRNEDND